MPNEAGEEPVADDEILFRRVSEASGWYDPTSDRPVAWLAFKPNENDVSGLSVWRAKYRSAAETATIGAQPGRRYFVLALRAGELRRVGVSIVPSPGEGGVGHVSLSNLNAIQYRENKDAMRNLAERIACEIVDRVDGPFGPF